MTDTKFVRLEMTRENWERNLATINSAWEHVFNDAVGDKSDADSAVASNVLRAEIRRLLEEAGATSDFVRLRFTEEQWASFLFGLETAEDSMGATPAIRDLIRNLRGRVLWGLG
jgi:hypothetical protein